MGKKQAFFSLRFKSSENKGVAYGILNPYFKSINVNNISIDSNNDIANFTGLKCIHPLFFISDSVLYTTYLLLKDILIKNIIR